MKSLPDILSKDERLVIGLMSGTSLDGMDAALVRLKGHGLKTETQLLSFISIPYSTEERQHILQLVAGETGGSRILSQFNFWLGQRCLEACMEVCRQASVSADQIDLVGSHGQTVFHIPVAEEYLGRPVASTFQLGEASVIAEGMGCPVVSDFRVRDMAAGGQGAPLVPYSEFLLYRSEKQHVGLQNIGGIGNITVLPRECSMDQVYAFDTGPGNMVIDQVVLRLTGGKLKWDENGEMAARGTVSQELLGWMLKDPYLQKKPPKTTGRELYGAAYVDQLLNEAEKLGLSTESVVATVTRFTAECIGLSWERFCTEKPELLIVGGGGAHNAALMEMIRQRLPAVRVVTNEDIGLNSDAKEAIAFAIMANECIFGGSNNVPGVTGARHPVIMGKISQ